MKPPRSVLLSLGLSGGLILTTTALGQLATAVIEIPDLPQPEGFSTHEVQANVFTGNGQESVSIAVDERTGHSLVVWGSRRQEDGGFGVFGRLMDRSGKPVGGEIHVNQTLTNNQEQPSVTFGPDGSAWVVWQSFLQDGDQGGIVMRGFGANEDGSFTALSDEIVVNQTRTGDQLQAAVSAGNDRVLVSWVTNDQGHEAVAVRMFDSAGHAIGDELRLVGGTQRHERLPTIAAQPDGFVVVRASRRLDGEPVELIGQRVGLTGALVGLPFTVARNTEAHPIEPAIDADDQGNIVVAWLASNERAGYDVLARRFDPLGVAIGDAFTVAKNDAGWKSGVAVATASDGRFVVAWNAEAAGPLQLNIKKPHTPADVLAQRFDSEGSRTGAPFRVHRQREGRQVLPIASNAHRIAWGDDDRLVFAWEGATGQDGSGVGVTTMVPASALAAAAESDHQQSVDASILATTTLATIDHVDRFPPDWDPFFEPEPRDRLVLNPGVDFGFQGFANTGWNPPDPDIAVGPNHVVVVVNGGIRFYTKTGSLTFADDISGRSGFWGSVGATNFVFDPVALYDIDSERYIVATTEHADNGADVINIAISDDDDPNGSWHKYRFNFSAVGNFIDFPNLGIGPDAIYVCCDYFSGNRGNRIHIFDKAKMLIGDPVTPKVVTTSGGFRSLGAVNHLSNEAPAQYFATAFDGSNAQIGIDAIRNPNGSPIRTNFRLSVPSFSQPPDAVQRGTSNRASTVDMRIKNGVYRDGSLWLAHTIGSGGVARVRWYEIAMNGWPTSGQVPTLIQSGTQNLGSGIYNWFADLAVDESGNVGLVFNQSSSTEYISVNRTFRLATDPAGTLRTPELQQQSTSPENGSRWGDYGGVEKDPVQPGVWWGHHEYRRSSWRTWVGSFDVSSFLGVQLTDVNVTFGSLLTGGLAQLRESDDDHLRTQSRFGFSALQPHLLTIEVGATAGTTTAATLDLEIEARLSQNGGVATVFVRNWATGQFEQVGQHPIGVTEVTRSFNGLDATKYIRGSDGRIEVLIKQVALITLSSTGVQSSIDFVGMTTN